jgi:hypothetical protein
MNPNFRKHVATAAMLLAPLGAALVALPAAAQYQPQYRVAQDQPQYRVAQDQPQYRAAQAPHGAPAIDSFVTELGGRLEPGRVLQFRLIGTPRSDVTVNIVNTVRDLPLHETQPGVYVGSYTIRRSDDVSLLNRAVATLRTGGQHTAARVNMADREQRFAGRSGRDDMPPRILDITPANGERLVDNGRSTRLSARLSDNRSGVDPASVRLRIDGRDVTAAARISTEEIRFRDDLPRGRHVAELSVRDRAGNESRAVWSFDVV